VGNPFNVDATINKSYYTLDSKGSNIVATEVAGTTPIAPCHGVIVEATSANDSVVFTKVAQQTNVVPDNGRLRIALTQVVEPDSRFASLRGGTTKQSTLDNAIITFNEGSQLGKFYFGHQNANIYISQGNQDYAIAFSEGQGEMPLNFKAKKNGNYTISVNPENVEMAYLHLIDNMTGADVDLIATSSYTFNAKTTDYASRFKLVFAVNDGPSTGSGTFAFISNGNIIVNGEGTLQVIDMKGRVIRSTNVAHNVSTSGMSAGVYVLRLVNGENVKTQKIVVR
jgi:hypothetical protein